MALVVVVGVDACSAVMLEVGWFGAGTSKNLSLGHDEYLNPSGGHVPLDNCICGGQYCN